jgi:flagellar basal-body rod modification protein FlgD
MQMSNFNVDLMNQLGLTSSAASSATSASNGKGSSKLGQSDFLKLMTTQLNNQDPTQPTDSSQMLAQMAQLSTVSGIQDMQSSLKQLVDTMMASQTTQAAALVGHQVIAAGSNAVLDSQGLRGAIDLSQDTNQLAVGIYDGAGQLVKQLDLGMQGKGTIPFAWDGVMDNGSTAPVGLYKIKAVANVSGSPQAMSTYVASTVDSVTVDSATKNITLNTSSGDAVKVNDIKQLM